MLERIPKDLLSKRSTLLSTSKTLYLKHEEHILNIQVCFDAKSLRAVCLTTSLKTSYQIGDKRAPLASISKQARNQREIFPLAGFGGSLSDTGIRALAIYRCPVITRQKLIVRECSLAKINDIKNSPRLEHLQSKKPALMFKQMVERSLVKLRAMNNFKQALVSKLEKSKSQETAVEKSADSENASSIESMSINELAGSSERQRHSHRSKSIPAKMHKEFSFRNKKRKKTCPSSLERPHQEGVASTVNTSPLSLIISELKAEHAPQSGDTPVFYSDDRPIRKSIETFSLWGKASSSPENANHQQLRKSRFCEESKRVAASLSELIKVEDEVKSPNGSRKNLGSISNIVEQDALKKDATIEFYQPDFKSPTSGNDFLELKQDGIGSLDTLNVENNLERDKGKVNIRTGSHHGQHSKSKEMVKDILSQPKSSQSRQGKKKAESMTMFELYPRRKINPRVNLLELISSDEGE